MRQVTLAAHRARNVPRRPPPSRWRRWLRRGLLAAGLLAATGVGGHAAIERGAVEKAGALADLAGSRLAALCGLVVNNVYAEGRRMTSEAALVGALEDVMGRPILAVDLEEVRERLQRLPWVRTVTVRRQFPDAILARLEEHSPLALWRKDDGLSLVDGKGSVIQVQDLRPFVQLPLLTGEDAPQNARALFAMLAVEPALAERVTAATRVGGRRWNVWLDGRIEVRLPAEGVSQAWQRLAEVEREKALLARTIEAVDLRTPDWLVLRKAPQPVLAGGGGRA
ncbi:cell division protein FtsQ/DivIB [Marinimicrococcus flavescens]|uniref:Cell division protein FtsQ n=1 Tax=Marinimicrococcus flavescens TaxID=3031815 RepID=A0AAP3XT04_9PROT|nr:cell division protein FtsQ/DivIB [Marinimicrococcus flavescens]